jgi:beta-N-acetylhexosaminidase
VALRRLVLARLREPSGPGERGAPTPRRGGRLAAAGLSALLTGAVLAGCTGPTDAAKGDLANRAATATSGSAGATASAAREARERGAFPVLSAAERIRLYASMRLSTMTLEQKIASMFIVHVPGADPAAVQSYLAANQAAGVLLLGDNVPGPSSQTAAFAAALQTGEGLGTLIAIDEEGGIVARLGDDGFAAADTLKGAPVEATNEAFTQRAALLESTGMSVNFGVVADVTADPSSFIYERVLGTDPAAASERVAAAVDAERGSVFSTLKHFPGHGETPADSHTSLPTTALPFAQWQQQDAPPFEAGIDAGAELVMFGHLVYSAVDAQPASLSAPWHDILRDDLGFEGVTVTDDLLMLESSGIPAYADRTANAVAAVAAGNDLLLYNSAVDMPPLVAAIAAAVRSGAIPPQVVDDAVLRDLELRRELWLRQHPDAVL